MFYHKLFISCVNRLMNLLVFDIWMRKLCFTYLYILNLFYFFLCFSLWQSSIHISHLFSKSKWITDLFFHFLSCYSAVSVILKAESFVTINTLASVASCRRFTFNFSITLNTFGNTPQKGRMLKLHDGTIST